MAPDPAKSLEGLLRCHKDLIYFYPLFILIYAPILYWELCLTRLFARRPVLIFHFASALRVWTEDSGYASLVFDGTLLSLHSLYELYAILYTYSVWVFYTKVIVNEYNGGSTRFLSFF